MSKSRNLEQLGVPADCDSGIGSIIDYWRSIAPVDGLPGRQHFDPTDIPRLLQDIWLIDVSRDPLDFSFRLVGTAIADFFGKDPTGRRLEDTFPDFTDGVAYRDLADVANFAKVRFRRGEPTLAPGSKIERLERVYLPMARNGKDVDMILCYTVFSPQAED
jgi:hypothetical protein